jgi:hypothetical protein
MAAWKPGEAPISPNRWKPGQSGNPSGSNARTKVRRLAVKHGPEAFRRLIELMRSDEPPVALRAAEAILDRAYGKPVPELVLAAEQVGFTIVVRQYVLDRNGHAPLPIPAGESEQAAERASDQPALVLEAPEPPRADVHIVVKHFTEARPADADR